MATPITSTEAVNKAYADTKIALAGVNAPDPAAGNVANSAFGTMTGPLILSRNPRPEDDITYFQFKQKNSRESGPVIVGLELKNRNDVLAIKTRMNNKGFQFNYLNDKEELFAQLIG